MKAHTLLAAAAAILFTAAASAQVPDGTPIADALALGRTFVREAGIRSYRRDDGPAIHAVIKFRSDYLYRSTYLEGLLRFTHGAPVSLDHDRPWITQLFPAGAEPDLYPYR